MNPPENILIVRTDRIGDVVLSLPMAAILKKHFPDCRVTFLLRGYTAPLALNNPYIDEVITLSETDGTASITENISLLRNRFDSCVAAFPTFRIALILFLSGIKTRIGTGYRWYSFLFNKKVYEHRKSGERHELEYNVRLLSRFGIHDEISEKNVCFGITPAKESRAEIGKDLAELGIDLSKKIVIIHPGSGGSAVDLPFDTLKSVVKQLSDEEIEILITGSNDETELCKGLIVNNRVKNLSGRYDLNGLIALIERCDLLIANSTGPIHIAAGLGRNVIGFYPKFRAASPKRWGPYTEKKILFTPSIDCRECTRRQCEELRCMDSIKAGEITDAAKRILGINGLRKEIRNMDLK
jgi:ADP-heptose:LPS heptosyltransferase